MIELEELKKKAESRANALETEIGQLRQEIRSFRELLDLKVTENALG